MEDAARRLLEGDQRTLSRMISYLERGDPQAAGVLKTIDPHTGNAYIVGITGPPGAGKSGGPACRVAAGQRVDSGHHWG